MKHRVSLFMLAATTLLSAPAFAAPVFMLQFGSFETRDEAQAKLSELQSKHKGVLGAMGSSIREVTLPPDNLTVYRTQAGPLSTRADAQSICSQLASNGDDCYVVETAMMPQTTPATQQVAQAAAPAATPSLAPLSAPTPAPMPAPATTAPQAVPAVSMSGIPARDPENMAAINRLTPASTTNTQLASAAAPAPAPVPAAPVASPDLQKAMEEAAAEQNNTPAGAPTPSGAKPEGSFWSRMNPFAANDPAPAPAPKPMVSAAATPAASSLEARAAATPPLPLLPTTNASAPAPVEEKPMIAQRAPVAAPAPIMMAAAPQPAPAPILPPPPAPLIGKGAIMANAAPVPAPAPAFAPAPVIVPQTTGSMPAPLVVPSPAAAPAPIQMGNAQNVRVGEAQRVPLSQQEATVPVIKPSLLATPQPMPPTVSLSPSATLGQKTLWAQIGLFNDAQTALAFWDNYRRAHPDFPVVRVRVTNNYQAMLRGLPQASLRVGPFAREGALKNLCATMPENQPQLRCGTVVDLGVAGQISGPQKGFLPGSRYSR